MDSADSSDWVESFNEKFKRRFWINKKNGNIVWKDPAGGDSTSSPSDAALTSATTPSAASDGSSKSSDYKTSATSSVYNANSNANANMNARANSVPNTTTYTNNTTSRSADKINSLSSGLTQPVPSSNFVGGSGSNGVASVPRAIKVGSIDKYLKKGGLKKENKQGDKDDYTFGVTSDEVVYVDFLKPLDHEGRRVYPLEQVMVQELDPRNPHHEKTFSFLSKQKSFYLTAPSKLEKDAWVQVIRGASENKQLNILGKKLTVGEMCPLRTAKKSVNNCECCYADFSFFSLRHHCQSCGKCVCNACSREKCRIPRIDQYKLHKVCNTCAEELKAQYHYKSHNSSESVIEATKPAVVDVKAASNPPSSSAPASSSNHSSATAALNKNVQTTNGSSQSGGIEGVISSEKLQGLNNRISTRSLNMSGFIQALKEENISDVDQIKVMQKLMEMQPEEGVSGSSQRLNGSKKKHPLAFSAGSSGSGSGSSNVTKGNNSSSGGATNSSYEPTTQVNSNGMSIVEIVGSNQLLAKYTKVYHTFSEKTCRNTMQVDGLDITHSDYYIKLIKMDAVECPGTGSYSTPSHPPTKVIRNPQPVNTNPFADVPATHQMNSPNISGAASSQKSTSSSGPVKNTNPFADHEVNVQEEEEEEEEMPTSHRAPPPVPNFAPSFRDSMPRIAPPPVPVKNTNETSGSGLPTFSPPPVPSLVPSSGSSSNKPVPPPPPSGASSKAPPPPPPPPASSKQVLIDLPPAASSSNSADVPEEFKKYYKMKDMFPEGVVRQKMSVDGFSEKQVNAFLAGGALSSPIPDDSSAKSSKPPPPPPSINSTNQAKPPPPPPPPSPKAAGGKSMSVMDQISGGVVKLKNVDKSAVEGSKKYNSADPSGLDNSLVVAMFKRRCNIKDDSSESGSGSDFD